jgi:hypothetical protein
MSYNTGGFEYFEYNCNIYFNQSTDFNQSTSPVHSEDDLDDRFNPRMWAKWFREFLEGLLRSREGLAPIREA